MFGYDEKSLNGHAAELAMAAARAKASAPKPTDPLAAFPAFVEEVRERLDYGRDAYGEGSFSVSPEALVIELQQEALDLAGWGFVLWSRLARIREACVRLAMSAEPGPVGMGAGGVAGTESDDE